MELLVVQYCREDADFNQKKITEIGQKMPKFQNFPNFDKNFSQFLGYTVCLGENYGGEKTSFQTKKNFQEKNFWGNFFIF